MATAATKAALTALLEGKFPQRVQVDLPSGKTTPHFKLCHSEFVPPQPTQANSKPHSLDKTPQPTQANFKTHSLDKTPERTYPTNPTTSSLDNQPTDHASNSYANSSTQPPFRLETRVKDWAAIAAVEKDAGDDPDVTHGAIITAEVRLTTKGGVRFFAGKGVGVVTKRGLPLEVGEPAINPTPRWMMEQAVAGLASGYGVDANADITISVPNGERLAQKTWNGKLGIIGGVSILGTSGVVIPYSCGAWIASIRQGVDVALAGNATTIAATTGKTSARGVEQTCGIVAEQIIEMGDFVGGLLKHLKAKKPPQPLRLVIGGGFTKIAKLAQGHLDLHSKRSQFDPAFAAGFASDPKLASLKSGGEMLEVANSKDATQMAKGIAASALTQVKRVLANPSIRLELLVFNKKAQCIGKCIGKC